MNSRTKPLNGASPVPAPNMMMGVVVRLGKRKLEALAAIQSFSPLVVLAHNISEQRPRKRRGWLAQAPSFCKYAEARGTSIPFVLSSFKTVWTGFVSSWTRLTQMPILVESSFEEEAMVYGRFFCLWQICTKADKSISADCMKSSKKSCKVRRPSRRTWYASRSCTSANSTSRSAASCTSGANRLAVDRCGSAQRSQ